MPEVEKIKKAGQVALSLPDICMVAYTEMPIRHWWGTRTLPGLMVLLWGDDEPIHLSYPNELARLDAFQEMLKYVRP